MALILGLILLVVLLIIGVPVFWTFLGVTVFLIVTLGYDPAFLLPYGYSQLSSPLLLAIPLFIIAGKLIERGGIGEVIVSWTESLVGKTKAGMGVTAIVACAIFGSISGSALAAASTIGSIMFGKLERAGYSRGFSSSLIANASILGLLIPPSGIMILYAWIANVSVLAAFLSTLIPGILLTVLLSVINIVWMRRSGDQSPTPVAAAASSAESQGSASAAGAPADFRAQPMPGRRGFFASEGGGAGRETLRAIPALLLPVIVLGGIYGGVFTTVEAAVVASIYAIPVGLWIYRKLTLREVPSVLIEAATTTGVVMVMAYSMMILSRVFIMERLPQSVSEVLLSISENPIVILLMINVFILLMGMLIDDVSGVLLLTPILLPVAVAAGVDPIHFAAILGVNLGMANVTPPTAPLLYFSSQLGKAPITAMLKPTLVMICVGWIPVLIITTVFPQVALFLPQVLLGYTPA